MTITNLLADHFVDHSINRLRLSWYDQDKNIDIQWDGINKVFVISQFRRTDILIHEDWNSIKKMFPNSNLADFDKLVGQWQLMEAL